METDSGWAKLRFFLRRNRAMMLILVIALAARLAFLIAVHPWDDQVVQNVIVVGDAIDYHGMAQSLMSSGSFEAFGTFRTPGYPVFLTAVYSVFGPRPWAALLLQVLIAAGTTVLVYVWAKLAVGRKAALAAAALYAIEPHAVFYSVTLLTDTLFLTVFLASVLALVQALKRRNLPIVLLSGFLLGVATLVKPTVQLFPVVAVLLILSWRGIRWPFRAKAAVGLAVVFALTISPWLCRNHIQYGHAELSSISGPNLLLWGATSTAVAETGRPVDELRDEFRETAKERGVTEGVNPFVRSRIYREVATEYINAHRVSYVKRHVRGVANMFLNVGSKTVADYLGLPSRELPFYHFAASSHGDVLRAFFKYKTPHEITIAAIFGVSYLIIYLSALLGFVASVRQRRYALLVVAVCVLVYTCMVVGPGGQPRYKLPILPFYLALSGLGLLEASRFVTRRFVRPRPALCSSDPPENR